MPKPPKMVKFEARPFSALIQDIPLAWKPPMRELFKDPDGADFTWRRLLYAFRLPDPQLFKPVHVALTTEERDLISRFVAHATSLAGTTLISSKDSMKVNIADFGDQETVTTDLSDPDVTIGFMALMRQCYAADEEASFSKVRKILEHRLHDAGDETSLGVLKKWRQAHARLMNDDLEALVQEQLILDHKMPAQFQDPDGNWSSAVVRAPATPSEMLRTLWYGDQLHWGSTRDQLAMIRADPFEDGMWEIATRQAATDFAHLYIGYAVLVDAVLNA